MSGDLPKRANIESNQMANSRTWTAIKIDLKSRHSVDGTFTLAMRRVVVQILYKLF